MVAYITVSMMHGHTNTKLRPVHNFTLIFNIHLPNILVSPATPRSSEESLLFRIKN